MVKYYFKHHQFVSDRKMSGGGLSCDVEALSILIGFTDLQNIIQETQKKLIISYPLIVPSSVPFDKLLNRIWTNLILSKKG